MRKLAQINRTTPKSDQTTCARLKYDIDNNFLDKRAFNTERILEIGSLALEINALNQTQKKLVSFIKLTFHIEEL